MRFEFQDRSFDFSERPWAIFGIVNVTPDSFSDGGCFLDPEQAAAHALKLQEEGADAIDIGGASTRPGAAAVPAEVELARVLPALRALRGRLRIPISIDTTSAAVAEAALAEGASILNDISGLTADPALAPLAARAGCGVILMHSRGTPSDMQTRCQYGDVAAEVRAELGDRLDAALRAGIRPERIALDPGIGFAKTAAQNWELLRKLCFFTGGPGPEEKAGVAFPGRPILIGVSRKSYLGGDVRDRGPGTLASEIWAWQQGVRMIRTHDAGALRRALEALRSIGKT